MQNEILIPEELPLASDEYYNYGFCVDIHCCHQFDCFCQQCATEILFKFCDATIEFLIKKMPELLMFANSELR